MSLWTRCKDGAYVAEASCLDYSRTPKDYPLCPQCNLPLLGAPETVDLNGDDVAGWRYTHPCGAKLLVIND